MEERVCVCVCVCVLFLLYSLYLEYDKIHFSPILCGVTQTCPPSPLLGQMYHRFLLPPITSPINWPPFLEYNLHIPSSDDNHSKHSLLMLSPGSLWCHRSGIPQPPKQSKAGLLEVPKWNSLDHTYSARWLCLGLARTGGRGVILS